ncbi:unnamed protein product, partial [Mesorhabditis spiculigera]
MGDEKGAEHMAAPPPYPDAQNSSVYPSVPGPAPYPQQNYGAYPPSPQPQMQQYPSQPTYQPSAPAHVITVQPTTVILNHQLGPYSCSVTCPNCHQTASTEVIYNAGLFAWLICGIMFIFGFWCCCCIPFCIDSCQDAEHRCRNCRHYLGTYKRM